MKIERFYGDNREFPSEEKVSSRFYLQKMPISCILMIGALYGQDIFACL